jgi:hypothetical protein
MIKYTNHRWGPTDDLVAAADHLESCIARLDRDLHSNQTIQNHSLGAFGTLSSKHHLFELCKFMGKRGFKMASFVSSEVDLEKKFNAKDKDLESDINKKPSHSIYFSYLKKVNEDSSTGRDENIAPEWYILMHKGDDKHDEKIDEYIGRDILFAKIDEKRITERLNVPKKIDQKLLLLMTRHRLSEEDAKRVLKLFTVPDYSKSSEKYDGVHFEAQPPLDIETVAVWNTECLTEMVRFKGVGNWTYDKIPTYEKGVVKGTYDRKLAFDKYFGNWTYDKTPTYEKGVDNGTYDRTPNYEKGVGNGTNDRKPAFKKYFDDWLHDKKSTYEKDGDNGTYGKETAFKKYFDNWTYDKKSTHEKDGDNGTYGKETAFKKYFDNWTYDKKSTHEKDGDNGTYGKEPAFKKYFDNWTYDKKSTYEKDGDNGTYGKEHAFKKYFDKSTHVKAPTKPKETKTLFELCKKYSLTQQKRLVAFIPNDLKFNGKLVEQYMTENHIPILDTSSELFKFGKPKNSIMFTRISNDETSSNLVQQFIPEIYEWLSNPKDERRDLLIDKRGDKQKIFDLLSRCDIAFGNVDEFQIFDSNTNKIPMTITEVGRNHYARFADCEEISKSRGKDNKGVEIHVSDVMLEDLWGVDTTAVWDRSCIENMTYYRNCGKWTYEKEEVFDYSKPHDE